MTCPRSGRGAAFSHGFSRKQEAEAGNRLMLEALDKTSDANIVRVLQGLNSSDTDPIPARGTPSGAIEFPFLYRPGKLFSPSDINHHEYVASILSSVSNIEVLDVIAQHFLGISLNEHARSLDNLRDAHRLLIRGDGDLALDAIRHDNALSPARRKVLIGIVCIHMRCWLSRTIRERADRLATLAREPRGTAFAGFTEWKTAGHVFLATQAAPAKLLQRIIAAARAGSFDDLTEQETADRLVELGLVNPADSDPLLLKLKGISYRLGRSGAFAWPSSFRSLHDRMAKDSLPLSLLTQRDMQLAGFSRMDLNGYRYGLNTSEIITWLALELHQAGRHLDACIDARLAGVPSPSRIVVDPSIKRLAFTATILRADAAGDRHAIDLDRAGSIHDLLDRNRNSGADPVRKMRKKLADSALANHLRAELTVDVTAWFRG